MDKVLAYLVCLLQIILLLKVMISFRTSKMQKLFGFKLT